MSNPEFKVKLVSILVSFYSSHIQLHRCRYRVDKVLDITMLLVR